MLTAVREGESGASGLSILRKIVLRIHRWENALFRPVAGLRLISQLQTGTSP